MMFENIMGHDEKKTYFEEVINKDQDIQQQLTNELTHNTEAVFTSLLNAIGLHPVFKQQ